MNAGTVQTDAAAMESVKIRPRLSKRHSLSKLATGWREAIFSAIKSARLKLAVAVLSASGCRPSELENGVLVGLGADGLLRIGIVGVKVNETMGRGQRHRGVVVNSGTPWGAYLREHVINEGKSVTITYDAGGISERLREKSRELWPRRKALVSAYSYRHFIGRALKESGTAPETIAKVLGHATDYAQNAYGRVRITKRGNGEHGILEAKATNPVRHSKKTDRLERFHVNREAPTPKGDGQ